LDRLSVKATPTRMLWVKCPWKKSSRKVFSLENFCCVRGRRTLRKNRRFAIGNVLHRRQGMDDFFHGQRAASQPLRSVPQWQSLRERDVSERIPTSGRWPRYYGEHPRVDTCPSRVGRGSDSAFKTVNSNVLLVGTPCVIPRNCTRGSMSGHACLSRSITNATAPL